mgnify:CR=1 FL=1
MRLTKDQLRKIIKEEVNKSLQTEFLGFGKEAKKKKQITKILDKSFAQGIMQLINKHFRLALARKMKSNEVFQFKPGRQMDLRDRETKGKLQRQFDSIAPNPPDDVSNIHSAVAQSLVELAEISPEIKDKLEGGFGIAKGVWDKAQANLAVAVKDRTTQGTLITKLLPALKEIGFDIDSYGIKALLGDSAPKGKVPTNSIKDYVEFYKKALR